MWHIFRMKRLKFKYQSSEFIPKTILTNLSATEPQHWNENTLRHKLKNKNHKKRKVYTQRLYIQPTWTCYIKVSKKKSHGSTLHDCSPALRCTDDVLFVAACTRFRQAGDGGCVTKQHCPGTNLSRKHKRGAVFDERRRRSRLNKAGAQTLTSSSGVMSQRQICPSWQPVMMVLKSSITSRLLMQCVGAVRPQSTMGRTKLFPDIMVRCLETEETMRLQCGRSLP